MTAVSESSHGTKTSRRPALYLRTDNEILHSTTISDEAALNGILFVLQTGIAWEDLPQALGYGSGMTCWRGLRDWNAAGVWEQLHHAMLVRLREHDQIDWNRASIDGSSVPSRKQAPTPQIEAS